ncbi:MAG: DUF4250 domain-containing protein [bacterium]|nr:DUF4250 domain-containing protein [bacterium]
MQTLPKDPMILLSYVNTQLRDFYKNLDDFCQSAGVQREDLCQKLAQIDYIYDEESRQFI